MSENASMSSGIAARYARAIFELSKEAGALDGLEQDIAALSGAITQSEDLRALIGNPIHSRNQMVAAVSALGSKMGLSELSTKTLGLMAQKRRLFVLPQFCEIVTGLIAGDKGEISAEVTTAKALTKAQSDKLAKSLKEALGQDVKMDLKVDAGLIGGMIVKVGSRMVDGSIRSKLSHLQNTMKEVG